jgi:hypothetical protein
MEARMSEELDDDRTTPIMSGSIIMTSATVNCLQNEIDALRKQLEELKTTTYCAYCGETFVLDDKAATMVTRHIYSCSQHPMREVEVVRDVITDLLIKANKQLDIAVEALKQVDWHTVTYYSDAIEMHDIAHNALAEIEKVRKGE